MKTCTPARERRIRDVSDICKALGIICALAGLIGCQGVSSNSTQSNPQVQASPAAISFGGVVVGSKQIQTETLTNPSASAVTISQVTVSGAGFSATGLSLPQMVAAGQSATFNVSFAPSTAGSVSGSIVISSGGSSASVTLTGTGTNSTQTGQLTISPSSLNFGNVAAGTSKTMTATLSASGASVTISSAPSTSATFSVSGVSFPLTIAAGNSASFALTFTPQGAGAVSENGSFISDASNSPTVLSGTGTGTVAPHPVPHGMFILDPPSNDGNCSGLPSACYSQHLVPTLICSGNNIPAGYNCTQAGAGEPYIKGAIFYVPWNLVSTSNGGYDFTVPDARAQAWMDAGKQVSFSFIPTSQESSNNVTPSWYLNPVNVSTVSQTGGIITLQTSSTMGFFAGGAAAGLEIQINGTGTALDGNGTLANPGIWLVCDHHTAGCQDPSAQTIYAIGSGSDIVSVHHGTVGNPVYGTVNCGSGTLPIEWRPNFIKAWQAFIEQAVAHYSSNNSVAYLRFGLGIGGENIPNHGTNVAACQAEMTTFGFTSSSTSVPWPSPGTSQWTSGVTPTWIAYLNTMLQYEHSTQSVKTIATTMSPIETSGTDLNTLDSTAADAVAVGIGIGNQGLQKSDPTNYAAGQPCLGGDWCANFVKYKGQVPLQLQTLNYSDPTDANAVGSLVNTVPFATGLGTQILELYMDDWMCTFDSSWNGNNTHSSCTAAGYPAVLEAASQTIN
jgi:hypothetical protein